MPDFAPDGKAEAANHDQGHQREVHDRVRHVPRDASAVGNIRQNVKACVAERGNRMEHAVPEGRSRAEFRQEPEKEEKVTAAVQEAESAAEEVSDSTAYITKGTRIEGNIMTDGSLDIIGTVEGDVSSYGKLIVSGVVNGKVNSREIYANAAKITGDICSTGSVKVGVGSVIVGNIEAQSAVIAGAVNGDLDVKGPVIVDSTAVIMGNIKSRSVQINNGAVIEGFCSQCYSDIDVKSFFA